ncbi:MAG: PEGA domain-containing protein [Candidatus Marinimicrobia bacterium]|nr:PEGA domain-containing protein [Candidatus Neomarinimicrobiota bacterium]
MVRSNQMYEPQGKPWTHCSAALSAEARRAQAGSSRELNHSCSSRRSSDESERRRITKYSRRWTVKYYLIILAFIIINLNARADDLAIMLFDFKDMDKIEITDFGLVQSVITDDLYSSMDCEVVSGPELENLLVQSGLSACDGIKCLSHIGKQLDIPIAITGVFNTSRQKYSLDINIINTTRAELVTSKHIDGPLDKIESELGWKLQKVIKSAIDANFGKIKLQVKTKPSQVTVSIDGRNIGRSPLDINDLRRGFQYNFKFDKAGFESQEQALVFKKKNERLAITLSEITGGFIFYGYPVSSKVFINNEFIGLLNDLTYNNSGGRYKISVKKPGYKPFNQTLKIESGSTRDVQVFLRKRSKLPSLLTSSIIPGSGQMLHSRWLRGFIMLAAAAGVGYLTYQEYLVYDSNYSSYQQALTTYNDQRDLNKIENDQAVANQRFTAMKDQEQYLNQYLAALGIVWTINLFEILIY